MAKYSVAVDWSGYSRGYSVYVVEAAHAYNTAAKELHCEFAKLNIIER